MRNGAKLPLAVSTLPIFQPTPPFPTSYHIILLQKRVGVGQRELSGLGKSEIKAGVR